ncbi:MAG: cytochrome c3 family protein [Phycisphaerales bacterium]
MRRTNKAILSALALMGVVACANLVPRSGWRADQGPVVPHDSFPADCSLCHEGGSWDRIKPDFEYDHEKETGVKLVGAHDTAQCLLCHNDRGPVAFFAEKGCRGCHEDVHRGSLGSLCQQCHDEDTWRPRRAIEEHARTRLPLIGGHAAVDCTACHPNAIEGIFNNAPIECEACHATDVTRSTSLDHIALGLTTGCDRCHTPVAWVPAGFAHPSSFPLSLGHGGLGCAECHTTPGVFTGLSTDCASCHLDDYQATTNPNHAAAGFSTDCRSCHTTAQWPGGGFIHPSTFPLTQAHSGHQCSACHTTPGVFVGLSTDCVSCHLAEYQATTNPNHASAGFSTACQTCHTPTAWGNATFSHPSSFPLTNSHAGHACTRCHTTPGVYTGLSNACITCHQSDFQNGHNGQGNTNCQQCHNTRNWD